MTSAYFSKKRGYLWTGTRGSKGLAVSEHLHVSIGHHDTTGIVDQTLVAAGLDREYAGTGTQESLHVDWAV